MTLHAMTLRAVVASDPARFYPQTWYDREPFMDRDAYWLMTALERAAPPFSHHGRPDVPAAALAWSYLRFPYDAVWQRYFWTSDADAKGQRVYVGGVSEANGCRFEIHRHLHLTDQWGYAVWPT
jgi:hypothetical protein